MQTLTNTHHTHTNTNLNRIPIHVQLYIHTTPYSHTYTCHFLFYFQLPSPPFTAYNCQLTYTVNVIVIYLHYDAVLILNSKLMLFLPSLLAESSASSFY